MMSASANTPAVVYHPVPLSFFTDTSQINIVLEVIDYHIDDEPGGDGDDESDDPMFDCVSSLFLVLGCECYKTHLKGSVNDHHHRDRRGETKDEFSRSAYHFRDIIEPDISIPDILHGFSSRSEDPGIISTSGSIDAIQKKGCECERGVKKIFHTNTKD